MCRHPTGCDSGATSTDGTTTSEVGRTQTAPGPDSKRPIRIGYFACQDYASGYYGAYAALLAQDPDFVVCGGDYIYDRVYSDSGYGGIRTDNAGEGPDSIARTIDQYRAKYRLYRSDPDHHELHRLVPLVAQWDDHEVVDNYVATHEGQAVGDDGEETDAYDRARILAGWKAWHEHMPSLRFGGSFRTYRKLRFGRMVELFMCDSRSYKDDQGCGGAGFKPCDDLDEPRTYLGADQLAWLKRGLAGSPAAWKVVGNQMMIMPFNLQDGVPVEVDSWNGYHAERNELLAHIGDNAKDVVFLTGDIHTFFAGEVTSTGRQGAPTDPAAVATEFVGGSITSEGILPPGVEDPGGLALEGAVDANNPHIKFSNFRERGYAVVEASSAELKVTFRAARTVKADTSDVFDLARFRVQRGTTVIQQL